MAALTVPPKKTHIHAFDRFTHYDYAQIVTPKVDDNHTNARQSSKMVEHKNVPPSTTSAPSFKQGEAKIKVNKINTWIFIISRGICTNF